MTTGTGVPWADGVRPTRPVEVDPVTWRAVRETPEVDTVTPGAAPLTQLVVPVTQTVVP